MWPCPGMKREESELKVCTIDSGTRHGTSFVFIVYKFSHKPSYVSLAARISYRHSHSPADLALDGHRVLAAAHVGSTKIFSPYIGRPLKRSSSGHSCLPLILDLLVFSLDRFSERNNCMNLMIYILCLCLVLLKK